jgi:hypothetical protein
MGGEYNTDGREEKCVQYFGWKKSERKTPLGIARSKCEDNIRMDLREIG